MDNLISLEAYRRSRYQVLLDREVNLFFRAIAAGDLDRAFRIMERIRQERQQSGLSFEP
ncbi:hypothetical protein EDC14_1001169 [Hydrogenispora ethanolica]|uniref:Uncharacterized protein n=1 Tax=Hydrogenispora ethanolica TaxID=1082276 RepID=A0A4R1SC55_HYDET|nr:hypothetical protein [Hydrogenispora ethanolica]TCL76884.1 hypothetical protein EDC14_1001169 [Hydrogenispora ethanolica]